MKQTKAECRPLATKVFNAINDGRPTLPDDKDLTARSLVGKPIWNTLDDAQRRFAGRFISICVRRGLLDLEQTRQDSCHHWRYRAKQA